MAKKFTLNDILAKIPTYLTLDIESFVSISTVAIFIDAEYGPYSAKPGAVIRGHGNHPKRVREKVKQTNLERLGVEYPSQSAAVKKKIKQTNLERLGVEYPTQSAAVREKVKQTSLEKYGVEFVAQDEGIKTKIKNSFIEKYGVAHPLQAEEIKAKAVTTLKKRYGVDNAMKSEEIKSKLKLTNLERYGCEYQTETENFKSKTQETLRQKYGVDNVFQLEDVKNKIRLTNLENLGVAYPMQSPEIRAKVDTTSKGELELKAFVDSFGLVSKKWYLGGNPAFELDIYIPELKLALEYNGDYWHSEANVPRDYHYLKSKKAKESGIHIIHIFESEWKHKSDIVKDFLLLHLGKPSRRYFARKLTLRPVSKLESREFFDTHHLQGSTARLAACYGLYSNDELLMAAAFSKPHRQNMSRELHLSRLVTKKGVQVVGGISKLSSQALKLHGPFVSYVHNRLSSGEAYRKAGFIEVGKVKPDYWYYDKNKKIVISKQSRKKKNMNTPKGMTEHEHALLDGLVRVYDCGKTKFRYS